MNGGNRAFHVVIAVTLQSFLLAEDLKRCQLK